MTIAAALRQLLLVLAAPPPTDPLGTVAQDPETARQQACKLLADSPTTCAKAKPSSNPPSNVDLSWLDLLLWVLVIAVLVAIVWLVVRAILNRTGHRSARAKHAGDSVDDVDIVERDAVAVDRSREPGNWRAEADDHRRAGRFREALRCRYRALVGDLARRGLIDEIPGRTTGEERAQLRHVQPAAGTPFDAAADLFDGAWYGHADVDAAADDHFQTLERDVLARAGARR
jgi:hypothetical protein